MRDALAGVSESLVVGGHTHQQVVRTVADAPGYVNAGSVGMPYEGRAAAFWLIIDDGEPELRTTTYDIDAAAGFGPDPGPPTPIARHPLPGC